nr:MAG: replication-associated protein [Canine parvovirus]
MSKSFVPFHHLDREWDARFNVQQQSDLDNLLSSVQKEAQQGKFKYALVSGVEVGTQQWHDDFGIRHVHLCLVFNNRVSKSAILKNFGVKQGNGYYLVPRNKELPYSGWRAHHTKAETKVDPAVTQLFEYGELPQDRPTPSAQVQKRSELEKKRKIDDVILEITELYKSNKKEEAFEKYPRATLTYGEKIEARLCQTRDFFSTEANPHVWLYGTPGSGKSALMQVIYPQYFNKNLDTKFFDRFDQNVHSHVLMQDVDHCSIEKLGVQFFKSICDEAGYPIDQKYKTPQICRLCVLITSNFTINDVVPEDLKGRRENLVALRRRFWEINVRDLLPFLGLKLIPKYEINQLKKSGNKDPAAVFMTWDYLRDAPVGEPLKDAAHYQKIIRDKYYA